MVHILVLVHDLKVDVVSVFLNVFEILNGLVDVFSCTGDFRFLFRPREIDCFPQVEDIQKETGCNNDDRIDTPKHHILVPVVKDQNGRSDSKHHADHY